MTRVTIDASTVAKLQGKGDSVEICDETGKVVGRFYALPKLPRDAQGKIISPISDEEIQRRSQQRTGRPLKDILEDLSKL